MLQYETGKPLNDTFNNKGRHFEQPQISYSHNPKMDNNLLNPLSFQISCNDSTNKMCHKTCSAHIGLS